MTTELEQQLRTDMERFTRDLHAPSGLAVRAFRHNQRRRVMVRAVTAAGSAAVLAGGLAAVALTAGNSGSAPPPQTRTAAYVVSRVSKALAPANAGSLISYSTTVFAGGSARIVSPAATGPGGSAPERSCSGSGSVWCSHDIRQWSYGGVTRESVYNVGGQHTFDLVTTTRRQSAVIYLSGTWWTITYAPRPALGPRGPACAQESGLRCQGWPAFIRSQLAYGSYAIVGHQLVDGVDAIKISVGPAKSDALERGYLQQLRFALWVDPSTYLPVRLSMAGQQQDFRWLPATAANLALTRLTVPAGFRQVTPPPTRG
jgi:hypothetical protein